MFFDILKRRWNLKNVTEKIKIIKILVFNFDIIKENLHFQTNYQPPYKTLFSS